MLFGIQPNPLGQLSHPTKSPMMNRCRICFAGLLLALAACTGPASLRPRSNYGGETGNVLLVKPAHQAVSEHESRNEPAKPVTRAMPYHEFLDEGALNTNTPTGYSSSPYGVDPIPEPGPDVANPAPAPYAAPLVETPTPPEETKSIEHSLSGSSAVNNPTEPRAFNMPAPPAVMALQSDIEGNIKTASYAEAAASLERAIRIQPKNPELWHVLAVVRLKQDQPGLAEDLAKKSSLLAKNNQELIHSNWALIAESRRMKGDAAGASDAMDKAGQ